MGPYCYIHDPGRFVIDIIVIPIHPHHPLERLAFDGCTTRWQRYQSNSLRAHNLTISRSVREWQVYQVPWNRNMPPMQTQVPALASTACSIFLLQMPCPILPWFRAPFCVLRGDKISRACNDLRGSWSMPRLVSFDRAAENSREKLCYSSGLGEDQSPPMRIGVSIPSSTFLN